jgi:hypothetical protein
MLTCYSHPIITSPPVSSRKIIEALGLIRGPSTIREIWLGLVNSMPLSPVNQCCSRRARKFSPLAAPARPPLFHGSVTDLYWQNTSL